MNVESRLSQPKIVKGLKPAESEPWAGMITIKFLFTFLPCNKFFIHPHVNHMPLC